MFHNLCRQQVYVTLNMIRVLIQKMSHFDPISACFIDGRL